jgi:1,4-dihydroxy-2-naphthoyl-CoA hydrolase
VAADRSQVTPDDIRSLLPGTFPGDLGIEPLEISAEHAVGRIVVDRRHLHPGGYVHGGVWTALADTVAAWATFRNMPPGHDFTTIELKLNVFAAGLPGDELRATARPLHVGRSTAVIETEIAKLPADGGDERLAAKFTATQFVVPPPG